MPLRTLAGFFAAAVPVCAAQATSMPITTRRTSVVATAQPGGRVATGDRVLLEVARAEGLDVVDLETARA